MRIRRPTTLTITAVVALLAAMTVTSWILWHGVATLDTRGYGDDLRDTVWRPVRNLVGGGIPWDVPTWREQFPAAQDFLFYSPHSLLIMSPLALLPWPWAIAPNFLIGTCALGVIAWRSMAAAHLRTSLARVLLATAALVVAVPGRSVLVGGNIAVYTSAASVVAITSRRTWIVALAVALAWMKPQPGFLLCLALIALRRPKPAILGTGLAVLLSLPVVTLVAERAGSWRGFLAVIQSNYDASAEDVLKHTGVIANPWPLDPVSAVARAWGLGGGFRTVLTLAIAISFACALRYVSDRCEDGAWTYSTAAAVCLCTLPTYLYAAPLGFLGLMTLGAEGFRTRDRRYWLGVALWSPLFLSVPGALGRLGLNWVAFFVLPVCLVGVVLLAVVSVRARNGQSALTFPGKLNRTFG